MSHEESIRVWNDPDGGELRLVNTLLRIIQETDNPDVLYIIQHEFTKPGANDQ